MANISVLKKGKVKAIRLSTLDAICKALECQPGDIWNTWNRNSPPGKEGRPKAGVVDDLATYIHELTRNRDR
jgi:putative transcriptional regulator